MASTWQLSSTTSQPLRAQALRVTGEQRRQPDVRQSQEEHDNPVQTQSTTGVGRTSLAEGVQVVLETLLVRVNSLCDHRGLQLLDVVDTLSTRHDLLATHEEVVRVGELRVFRIGLGVEGSQGHGELVEDEEVGVILLPDNLAQLFFHRCRQVVLKSFLLRDVDTGVLQQCHTVHIVESQGLAILGELEVAGLGVRLLNDRNLVLIPFLKLAKDEDKEVLSKLQNLMVVAAEGLFKIETGELHNMKLSANQSRYIPLRK